MEDNKQIRVLTKSVLAKNSDYFEPYCLGIAKELGIKIILLKTGTKYYLLWTDMIFKIVITGEPAMLDIFEENY